MTRRSNAARVIGWANGCSDTFSTAAAQPIAALAENEKNYRPENGGIDEHIAEPETESKLNASTHLLMRLSIPVIPTMLFADAQGQTTLIQGALTPLALHKVFRRLSN